MRLKPKVLFLIGGLAAISVASSQNTANMAVSETSLQTYKTLKLLYAETRLNRTDLAITANILSQDDFYA